MDVTRIRIEDFDYPLPSERIASHPCEPRDACRLMAVDGRGDASHHAFSELPELLPQGALLVYNNTRVINARIAMRKSSGAAIEIFCLEPLAPRDYDRAFAATGCCRWSCLVGNLKKWKQEPLTKRLTLPDGSEALLTATRLEPLPDGSREIEFSWTPAGVPFATIIEAAGYIPIPPYLNRESEPADAGDYQTVYSRVKGSVAAPTAGLHFTDALLRRIDEAGIRRSPLTLHVGAGTFRPVKSEEIGAHPMHTEVFAVSRRLISDLLEALACGRAIVAVGTTTVRTLESLPLLGLHALRGEPLHVGQWEAYSAPEFSVREALEGLLSLIGPAPDDSLTASTAIMIAPGFRWRLVSGMVTNFHQPQSTLLLLVSSFLTRDGRPAPADWRTLYGEALTRGYRFLSYGDAMLIF